MKRKTGTMLNWVVMLSMLFGFVATPAFAASSPRAEIQPETALSNPEYGASKLQAPDVAQDFAPVVFSSMHNDLSPALRDIALEYSPQEMAQRAVELGFVLPKAQLSTGDRAFDSAILESEKPVTPSIPAPFQSFDGVGNLFGGWPPDTEGDIGPNHYMQWINLHFAIWQIDKVNHTNTLVLGPLPGSALFTGFGGVCEFNNDGDPIVLYDSYSNRWFASQFALPSFPNGPFYQCSAVSQTSDPTGAWYRYQYQWPTNKMNDYPKFGVWPDAYYMTANQFNAGSLSWGGAGVVAFERAAMLQGLPAQAVYFDLFPVNSNYGGMLPADADGATPPPAGAPGLFAEWDDSTWIGPNDAVRIWEFVVDWVTGNSTFGVAGNPNYTLTTTNVDPDMCGFARNCIPQPSTTARLDAISDRIMHRLQYRNMGGHQSMVTNHTVDANGADHAAPHWFELRNSGAGWVLHQEGVYAPDATHRWMGSAAMDSTGNIALGYSASSTSVFPSVWYAGRLAGDPLGTLPQGEGSIVNGTGSQTDLSNSRWGDYSAMGVDPVDDCTFWYTQEYVQTTGTNTWKTRIGEFKFPNCVAGPSGTLNGTVTDANTLAPIAGANIFADGGSDYNATTNASGAYTLTAAVDTYTVTASAFGYLPNLVTGVVVVSGTITTQDFALTPSPMASVSGVVTDAATGWPLYSEISITGVPGTLWTDPVTGYYTVTLPTGATYDFTVNAWVPGYNAANVSVGPLAGNTTQDFALVADPVACNAPGYTLQTIGLFEGFDSTSTPAGWNVVNNGGTCPWEFNDPGSRGNLTGGSGNFAVADSDICGSGTTMNTDLYSPIIDVSSLAAVPFEFKYDYNNLSSGEVAAVDVSANGGASWTNLVTWNTDQRGPASFSQDVTAQLGGSTQAQVRFRYVAPGWDWWWEVDEVLLGVQSCIPPANGGLVVGNVYDENTQLPVTGASVINDYGFSATAIDTPADNNVDDGFYTLFSPAGVGAVNHYASFTDYGIDFAAVDVTNGGTVEQEFHLPAGQLDATPPALTATLDFGQVETQQITLTNMGAISLTFNIAEVDGGMIPSAPSHRPVVTAPLLDVITIGDLSFSANPSGKEGAYRTPAFPERAPEAQTLTHSLSQTIIALNSVSCNAGGLHADNSYFRVFDLPAFGITGAFNVTDVDIGIETAVGSGGTQPATVNLYTLTGPFLWANLTPIGTASVQVSDQSLTILNVPVTGFAPAGSMLVVEFFTPNGQVAGHSLFVGSNNLGETAPTYLAAADCVVVEPATTGSLGFPGMHMVMNVTGDEVGDPVPWLSEDPITGTLSGMPVIPPPFAAAPVQQVGGDGPAQEVVGDEEPQGTAEVSALGLVSKPFAPAAVLYNNGPLVTNPGGGSGGADLSALQSSLGLNTYGFGHQFPLGYRMADDFTVSATEGWMVDTITFYAYQTGSTITSTFTGGYLQIWDGPPDNPASSVVWGDLVTNRLVNTTWSGIYRADESTPTSATRPIMANTYAVGAHLPAGTYWLDWNAAGVLASGPWAPPISLLGQTTTGNAIQYTTAWAAALDTATGAQQGMPFVLEGSIFNPQVVVDVTFDASVPEVDQPGEYQATLEVNNDSPYGPVSVPVSMFVNVPPTWGKLQGTVTGLGYCDANPAALAGAEVVIEDSGGVTVTVTTDASGNYQRWFDAADGPFNVSVTYPNHAAGSASAVVVSAGGTTTQDFDLRLLEACMSADPTSLEVTIGQGYTARKPLDLNNDGAAGSDFQISELPGGYTPLVLGAKPLPNKTKSPDTEVGPWTHAVLSPVAVGDELFQFDATAWTGHICILGLEYALGSIWVTSGGETGCTTGTDNYLFQLDPGGSVINSWNQNTTSQFGWRDLAFDGTYLYASDSAVVVQINPATGAATGVTIPSPQNPARALAYDPVTDHFWTANFGSSIYEFDRTGAVVNTFANSLSIYGAAWDEYSSGGPYLWVWSQDGTPLVLATQINPASGAQTGVSFVGTSTDGTDAAGGATMINGDYPGYSGKLIFLGMHQAGSDIAIGYDMDTFVNFDVPWMSQDPITGTIPADSSAPIDVSFNETMTFTLGTYTATLRISTDDPVAPTLFVPVTMHIVPPEYGVQVSPDMGLTGIPGETITYTVYVTNTSNGPTDSFDIALGSSTFPSSASVSSVGPLSPGEMAMFTVTVDIPWGTASGSTDALVVTATSQGDATKTDSVTLTTTVGQPPTVYLPVVPQGYSPP